MKTSGIARIEIDGMALGGDGEFILDRRSWPVVDWFLEFSVKGIDPQWLYGRWRSSRVLPVDMYAGRGRRWRGEGRLVSVPLAGRNFDDRKALLEGVGRITRNDAESKP